MIIASCGLAYELIAGALASYVLGDSVLQFSTIIGTYLFAMGVGSHLSKYVPENKLLQRFVDIEVLVGLIGGLSAIGLFLAFAWLPRFQSLLYILVFFIGMLVGMEIPLVMRILHARKQAFSDVVSKVLTFDYLGALVVSVLFPLVLAPKLGLARSAVLFGLLNVAIAWLTVWHFFSNDVRHGNASNNADNDTDKDSDKDKATEPKPLIPSDKKQRKKVRQGLHIRILLALVVLIVAFVFADNLVKISEQKRFRAPIIFATSSQYQRLVVTERHSRYQLFLNGNLQFSTRDEHRYHEALVHPVMQTMRKKISPMRSTLRVLILGGGDGMAVREVLKYKEVAGITLVDLDKKMTDVFAHEPRFADLNQNSLTNDRVTIINDDAFHWVDNYTGEPFDVVIIDLPDPSQYALGKLYSVSMYKLVQQHLTNDGLMVVQSTSPYYAPKSFWSINKTIEASGFATTPYHTYVPSFGEWGYIIGQPLASSRLHPFTPPQTYDLPMKFLTPAVSNAMFEFSADMTEPVAEQLEVNTIDKQPLVRYYHQDWSDE